MNCRTRKRKEEICRQYYIQPVNYLKLLNGQHKEGCCGSLDDKYYTFSYKLRGDYKASPQYFFVGTHCANEFLDITKQDPLPLFNPLVHEQENHTPGNSPSSCSGDNKRLHPFNKELLTAINMLCISWDIIPESGLDKIITFTRRRSETQNYNGIEWFNEIVGKDRQRRSLRIMIDQLRENNELKDLRFDELNNYLNERDIVNNIN
ncbi:hypothetical protein ACFCT7_06050 [Fulvivirgaceae bacterium LMO-SS25]